MWYTKLQLAFFKLLNLLTNGNTDMQINVKFPITNLNKQNLYYMERSFYGHMQTMHATMPTMSPFKIIQKKLMNSQSHVPVYRTVHVALACPLLLYGASK